ncbi:MAG: insulinase family protein [Clostridiales bacterium]|nr:insulinase family protein [Clostridiales bacterium]
MKDIEKISIGQGINLYILNTDKFKTVSISYCFHRDLDEDYTYNALLPAVMRRGSKDFKALKDIERYLEGEYGTIFDVGVQKRGERHLLRFSVDVINDSFLPNENAGLVARGFEFLNSIINRPVLENGVFKADYVAQEKQNLKNSIESLINDKMGYSIERLIRVMCQDEKYSRYVHGSVEDLEKIDAASLYKAYEDVIASSPLDIFVVGNVDGLDIESIVKNSLDLNKRVVKAIPKPIIKKLIKEPKEHIESLDINQGKLNLGFRTGVCPASEEYYPLAICSSVFGGGPHSKLFINVREKASLAYYAFSRLDSFKGLMLVGAGIDFDNYDVAVDIIKEQFQDLKSGKITDKEIDASKKIITGSMKGIKDQSGRIINYYLGNVIAGRDTTIDESIDRINSVTLDDVKAVAEKIELDTIYFLKN